MNTGGYSDSTAIGTGMNYISDKLKKLNIEDD